ncbi:hypothetical protein DD902_13180 [Staphylococcus pseudintermedius]|uniref:Uncharacterized protein n=1 Tax=Staphylococcus pseudintermedius TaxID=283734 RepID=A0A317YMB7_STAPS|nr:hypothetical protein DD902_13180 [Staphylococcus pseudintermedius]
MLTASPVLVDPDALAHAVGRLVPGTELTTDSNSAAVPFFVALSLHASSVDPSVLAPSLVDRPFDAALLNELTAFIYSRAAEHSDLHVGGRRHRQMCIGVSVDIVQ